MCLQVTFEGITGSSYTGDVAIDQVKITEGDCPGEQFYKHHQIIKHKYLIVSFMRGMKESTNEIKHEYLIKYHSCAAASLIFVSLLLIFIILLRVGQQGAQLNLTTNEFWPNCGRNGTS